MVGPGTSGLPDRMTEALEGLAFNWILNADTYVEAKFQDLVKAREKVQYLKLRRFPPARAERSASGCIHRAVLPMMDTATGLPKECMRTLPKPSWWIMSDICHFSTSLGKP